MSWHARGVGRIRRIYRGFETEIELLWTGACVPMQ